MNTDDNIQRNKKSKTNLKSLSKGTPMYLLTLQPNITGILTARDAGLQA